MLGEVVVLPDLGGHERAFLALPLRCYESRQADPDGAQSRLGVHLKPRPSPDLERT
jgi:hypothetical protein